MTRQASTHLSAKTPGMSARIPKHNPEMAKRGDPEQLPLRDVLVKVAGTWLWQPQPGRGEGHIWDRKGHTWSAQTPCPGAAGGGGSRWRPSRAPSAPVTF